MHTGSVWYYDKVMYGKCGCMEKASVELRTREFAIIYGYEFMEAEYGVASLYKIMNVLKYVKAI